MGRDTRLIPPRGAPPPGPRDQPAEATGDQGRHTRIIDRGGGLEPPPGGGGDDPPPDPGPQILPSDKATQRTTPDPRGREIPTTSPEGDPIPVSFGKSRNAPDLIYLQSDGISKLYFAWSWGWGPNNALYDFELDNSPGSTYGFFEGSTTFNVYLGTPDQPLDPLLSGFDPDNWFSAYPGLCYVTGVLDNRIVKNQTVNPTNFKATIEGLLSPDHRADPTLVTTYYHENAVLALAHLFIDQSWGFQVDGTEQMMWPSWDESADDAELSVGTPTDGAPTVALSAVISGWGGISSPGTREWAYTWIYDNGLETTLSPPSSEISQIPSSYAVNLYSIDQGTANVAKIRLYRRKKTTTEPYGPWNFVKELDPKQSTYHDTSPDIQSGGSHPPSSDDKAQFRIGLKMDKQATMRDWIETFRTLFTGFVAFNNGQFQAYVDKVRDATGFVYNETNISGNLELTSVGIANIPGRTIVNVVDQDSGFINVDCIYPPGAPVASEAILRSERRDFTFHCDGCPSIDQGNRISMWAWKRGQRRYRLRWRVAQQGILVMPGSVISVSMDIIGAAAVIVTSTAPVDDSLGWNLAGEIYNVDDFSTTFGGGGIGSGGGSDSGPPEGPPPPPTDLILRWRVYNDHLVIVPDPG